MSITETLVDGLETEGILQRVRDGRADLVVMATHGRGPLGRFFLGSVADVLVRETSVPVLLVRPHGAGPDSGAAAEDVLVPLDGPPLAEQILGPAADLARLTGATVTLLRVVLPPPAYGMDLPPYAAAGAADLALLEDLRHEAEAYLTRVALCPQPVGHAVETRVVAHAHAATGLLEEAARTGCDLIALETHGRRGLPRLFLGSVADKVVRGAEVPVLLYRSLTGAP